MDKSLFGIATIATLGALAYSAVIYESVPDSVPTHINLAGDVDAWGPKSSIWIMPGIMLILTIILFVVAVFNTSGQKKDGTKLSEMGRAAVVGSMRRMLGIMSLCFAAFAWDAVLTTSRADAAPSQVLTIAGLVVLLVSVLFYVWRMLSVMRRDTGEDPANGVQ